MINHNERFEELATAPVKQTDVIVVRKIIEDGTYVDSTPKWESSTILSSVNIDAVGTMLGSATKKAKVNLLGIVEGIVAGDIFQIRLGIDDVGSMNYTSQGMFIVDDVEYNYDAGSTSVIMYDHMWRASKSLYVETMADQAIEYPITVQQLAEYVADVLDLTLMDGFEDLPNSQYLILEDLYSETKGATLQNAIQDIAGATGTTARVTESTLVFSSYEVVGETLDSDTLKQLKIGETYGPVTSVILGRVPANDNIAVFATHPTPGIVEGVDVLNNELTIEEHDMLVGNMIKLEATGTLPAPLEADKFYYVTDTMVNTFKLSPTYLDAVTASNIITLESTGSGTIRVVDLGTQEIQINNNQIVDDDRQDLLPPLYDVLSAIEWTDVKASTVGLGWHEVGDVIKFQQGDVIVKAFLSEIHLVLDGSIGESLISTVPDVAAIDYQSAGGVIRTLYNTEIKVDKQNQEISSVVERQSEFEGVVNEDFTSIRQDIENINLTVQRSGGGNLLYNSVGYASEDEVDADDVRFPRLLSWDYPEDYTVADNGEVISDDSSESQSYGGVSGRLIEVKTDYVNGKVMTLKQRVNVAVGASLSFGLRVRNAIATGTATITISNSADSFIIEIPADEGYIWTEFKLEDFQSSLPWLDVEIEVSAAQFRFTDARLIYGTNLTNWTQANGEILSTNVQFSSEGMRIFDSEHDTETRVTYNEFSTRRKTDGTVLFEADDSGVITNDLSVKGEVDYINSGEVVIKQITIPKGSPLAGIAFIKG